ncbi:cAMP-dependent protein kinase type II-beta regulatory subunit, partial [Ophiophagus hannah]
MIKTKAKQTPAGNIILVVTQKQKVCAEAYNPDEEEDDTELRVIHPKTDDQRNRLQEACKDILLFKNLDQEQMSQVLDAMFEKLVEGGEHDRVTFRRIIVKNNAKKRRMYENFIESLPFLKSLELSERLKVVDVIGTKIYKDGEQIIAQGDTADSFFIVESGEVKITMKRKGKQDIDGKEAVEIARYTRGQLLGPCMEIMKRNIANYEEQLVALFGTNMDISEPSA